MCGLAAWCGRPDPEVAEAMIRAAGQRGAHGSGWTWLQNERLEKFVSTDRADDVAEFVSHYQTPLLLFHARLASSGVGGDQASLFDRQPLVAGDLAVGHNGNVPQWPRIRWDRGLELTTSIDSEVILRLAASYPGSTERRIWRALGSVPADSPLALLAVGTDGRLAAIRRDRREPSYRVAHPLWLRRDPGCVYVSSVPTEDGRWHELVPNAMFAFDAARVLAEQTS